MRPRFLFPLLLVFALLTMAFIVQLQEIEYPELTVDMIAGAAGLVLTFVFAYFPNLNTWYAGKDDAFKKLFMAGVVTLFAVAAFGLGCAGYLTVLFQVTVVCTLESAVGLLRAIVVGLVVNQGVYRILPEAKAVTAAKAMRSPSRDDIPHAWGPQ